jgi:hypothetical protein
MLAFEYNLRRIVARDRPIAGTLHAISPLSTSLLKVPFW